MKPETVKVKPWADSQGEFVIVNKKDFDKHPGKYELFGVESEPVDKPVVRRGRPPKAE